MRYFLIYYEVICAQTPHTIHVMNILNIYWVSEDKMYSFNNKILYLVLKNTFIFARIVSFSKFQNCFTHSLSEKWVFIANNQKRGSKILSIYSVSISEVVINQCLRSYWVLFLFFNQSLNTTKCITKWSEKKLLK